MITFENPLIVGGGGVSQEKLKDWHDINLLLAKNVDKYDGTYEIATNGQNGDRVIINRVPPNVKIEQVNSNVSIGDET